MVEIKQVVSDLRTSGLTKYRIAKMLEVQPIMIDKYLDGKVLSPHFRICKKIYDAYGIVTFPYKEEELKDRNEQTLMEL